MNRLNLVNKASSRGERTQSGIHSYLYLKLSKGKIGMRCWNGICMLMTAIQEGVIEVEGEGSMLLPMDKLYHVVSNSTVKNITIEEIKETRYKIRGNGKTELNGIPVSQFPDLKIDGEFVCETTLQDYCKRASSVLSCVATGEISNQALQMVNWNGDFVASDGQRMAIHRGEKLKNNFLIPPGPLTLLLDVHKEIENSPLKIMRIEDRSLIFKMNGCIITTMLGQGTYPNYEKIVEKFGKGTQSIEFDKKDMMAILDRASIFQESNRAISLKTMEDKLLFKIGSNEAHSEYVKNVKFKSGMDIEIYVAISIFQDCIRNSQEDKIVLQFNDTKQPMVVNQKKWFYMLVPMTKGV